jgi:hypothetical protein
MARKNAYQAEYDRWLKQGKHDRETAQLTAKAGSYD